MNTDKVALYGLIAGVVGGVAGLIGAVAAVFAAFYAKGSATQRSLEIVEQNTASTAQEVIAVKGHIAQVDEHLRIQNNRESLDLVAESTNISVTGEGWNNEPQKFLLTVRTSGVSLITNGSGRERSILKMKERLSARLRAVLLKR